MLSNLRTWRLPALLVLATALTSCSLPRMIDSDVQSFAGASALVSPADFRFERLPSQQNSSVQDTVENLTQEALERVGVMRNDASGLYLVMVGLGVDNIRNPHYRPPRSRFIRGADGRLYEDRPLTPDIEVPWYRHRVHLTLRDSTTSQVAYETTAVFDGPWRDTLNLLPPMLEAALKDYPMPVQRKVVVELPAANKENP